MKTLCGQAFWLSIGSRLPRRAIAFGFLEAPLKGKLLLPTADLGDSVLVVNRFETATSPWLPTMASESGYAVSVNDGCRACQTTQCGKTRWPSSCLRKHLTRERSSVERPGRESRDYTPPVFGEAGFGEGSLTTSRLGARVTVIVYVPVTEASSAVTVTVMTFSPTSSGT